MLYSQHITFYSPNKINIPMGQFGFFNTDKETEAFDLIFKKRKSAEEAAEELEKKNLPMTMEQLLNFKEHAFDIMKVHEKKEQMADYFLESYDRIKHEFEWMVDKTKDLVEKAEAENDKFSDIKQLAALKEFHSQIKTTLVKMGKLTVDLNRSSEDSGTIINAQNVLVLVKGVQENWFKEMNAELINGKLVFNDPKPEMIDAFQVWERKYKEQTSKQGKIHVV